MLPFFHTHTYLSLSLLSLCVCVCACVCVRVCVWCFTYHEHLLGVVILRYVVVVYIDVEDDVPAGPEFQNDFLMYGWIMTIVTVIWIMTY